MDKTTLWFEIYQLPQGCADSANYYGLEEWTELFADGHLYEITPRENAGSPLPIGVLYFDSRCMLRDRLLSLQHADLHEAYGNRCPASGLMINTANAGAIDAAPSYVVIKTLQNGESFVYKAGPYLDRVVKAAAQWRGAKRRVGYDTLHGASLS
ncbi:anthranilate 1,2-dioxygenase [Collimonas humicola]|uniref:anthranilate 1,2-dioxygenase n=1 Tax=Collimonas humicola TaxID=2825886 RepID=UPI001B8C08C9|nr:anthranilate 1,2-dioxygenase [Collimonas humicola]